MKLNHGAGRYGPLKARLAISISPPFLLNYDYKLLLRSLRSAAITSDSVGNSRKTFLSTGLETGLNQIELFKTTNSVVIKIEVSEKIM